MDVARFKEHWSCKNPRQKVFMVLGSLSLLLAVVGLFLPIVPQVPFAILAAFFFSRGSREIHQWLRSTPHMGPPIRDWEDHGVIRPRLKFFSLAAMTVGAVLGHFQLGMNTALILDALFLASALFILTRPSMPDHP